MTNRIFIIIVILSGAALCPAADNGFERALLPLLENHCFDCHDEDTQKGDLALDSLNPDVVNGGDEAVWAAVLDQLNSGEMPPKKKKRPPEKRLLTALNWLTEELGKAQFDKADLLIQFLHMPALSDEQIKTYQAFVDGGGGVVSIHESVILRPLALAEKYAVCIGCSWKGNKSSKWGKFGHDTPLYLKTDHAAFAGLPETIKLSDESYWNMIQRDSVEVIGVVAPQTENTFSEIEKGKDARGQAFWTYTSGKGRVFGTTTGHYSYTYHDPLYRILLMRGIAWAVKENPAPFMPIVFAGITDDNGLVGTKDSMMNYKNRKK